MAQTGTRTILLAGANRGLGLGLAREFAKRGWRVIATARDPAGAEGLTALQKEKGIAVEALDLMDTGSIAALAERLDGQRLGALFVVAGISGAKNRTPRDLTHEEIAREFITNATAPVALAESLVPLLAPQAPVAFMTSILGSIGSNSSAGTDLYRASKAALNMLGVNFSLRHKERSVLLLHPGWVRTDMGGSNAPVDVETSSKGLADLIEARHRAGAHYLDYQGKTLPW